MKLKVKIVLAALCCAACAGLSANVSPNDWDWEFSEGDAGDVWGNAAHASDTYIVANELESVFRRQIDIRNDPSEVGVWIRGETGKMKIDGYGYDYNQTDSGYDWKHETDDDYYFAGFAITHSINLCDTGIIGHTNSTGYNLYGSWLDKENKAYVDLVIKYGTLSKKYAGEDIYGLMASGDYNKDVFSVSAKYGRRYEKNDFYYEPFVGLTWGRVGSADFRDARGFDIHSDSVTSKIASLGVQAGKKVGKHDIYYRMNLVHDFDGEMHARIPGTDIEVKNDMGGTWLKCALGTSSKIGKHSSYHIELGKDFGNKVKKTWSISAGYNHSF